MSIFNLFIFCSSCSLKWLWMGNYLSLRMFWDVIFSCLLDASLAGYNFRLTVIFPQHFAKMTSVFSGIYCGQRAVWFPKCCFFVGNLVSFKTGLWSCSQVSNNGCRSRFIFICSAGPLEYIFKSEIHAFNSEKFSASIPSKLLFLKLFLLFLSSKNLRLVGSNIFKGSWLYFIGVSFCFSVLPSG